MPRYLTDADLDAQHPANCDAIYYMLLAGYEMGVHVADVHTHCAKCGAPLKKSAKNPVCWACEHGTGKKKRQPRLTADEEAALCARIAELSGDGMSVRGISRSLEVSHSVVERRMMLMREGRG